MNQHIAEDDTKIDASTWVFVYLFSNKQTITIPIIPKDTNCHFGFKLCDYDLMGQTFVDKLKPCSSVEQNIAKTTCNCLQCSYITYINGDPVYDTKGARQILLDLYTEHI